MAERGISEKRAAVERCNSTMSVEDTASSGSRSSESVEDASASRAGSMLAHDEELQQHLSRVSSTNAVGGIAPADLQKSWTGRSTAMTTDPAFEVDFGVDDKSNPQNWPVWYKSLITVTMSFATASVVLYSTSYTSAIPGVVAQFNLTEIEGILGVTTYLLGMAAGSLVLAPLSEMYGRRPIYIIAMGLFTLFVLPCALAQNFATILVMRFLGAFCAAAMISNSPGSVNDVVDEEHRALAFSVWAIGPMNGPVIGPVVGGFVYQYLDWRWTNWVVMIVAGVSWIAVSLIPETYAPALLRKRAAKLRKRNEDDRYWSRYDDKLGVWPLLKLNLSRPVQLAMSEPICMFWDVYVALVYGVLYLCFVAYPIVFEDERGWSPGLTGLSFCGIGLGSMTAIVSEPLIRKWINSHPRDPLTGRVQPEAMVSVICLAAILIPVGEIWFAWTCTPNVFWIVPILAGIPFGAGNCIIFIYASNYMVYSYGVYAASALAGNAVLRSVLGATLPLAGPKLYSSLGANWAGTLLGLLEALCIPIPFIFYRYGAKIRARSPLIRRMQEDKAKMDRKRARAAEKEAAQRLEAEALGGALAPAAAMDEIAEELRVVETKHY